MTADKQQERARCIDCKWLEVSTGYPRYICHVPIQRNQAYDPIRGWYFMTGDARDRNVDGRCKHQQKTKKAWFKSLFRTNSK